MFTTIVESIKKSPFVLIIWYLIGKPIPPPHIYKQKVVSRYGKKFLINTLIESGTYKGDMVYGVRNKFKSILTIELSNYFFKKAKERLKTYKNIKVLLGDSGKKIGMLLRSINEPCIFWLDGHYSSGDTAKGKTNTPIVSEVKSILNHKIRTHVILIDDARCFNGKNDYPKITSLRSMLKKSNYNLTVRDDIIRITPQTFLGRIININFLS